MASHPYISGSGNITQIVGLLRKTFPSTVTSETVKKYGLAPNNESYVINALQFIGAIDEDGKRTDRGHEVFTLHDEQEFQKAFGDLIRGAYKDLFELHGDAAWTLSKEKLVGYFRTTDKTSDVIGGRQASVFQAFSALAGHSDGSVAIKPPAKPKAKAANAVKTKKESPAAESKNGKLTAHNGTGAARDMALTVRIEINLPADGTRETYDNIFQSIRANLLNE
jgi:hypothetical protein